ncbi:MAG: serine/threonine-protein kinase [Gemmatimonadota bacterium]|nr:serine/threonine-protein kinase [Gemmatimonadota bacterium]
MTEGGDRLHRLRELFDAVMDQPAAERSEYLARATKDDSMMRLEIEALIIASETTDSRLSSPLGSDLDGGESPAGLVGQRLGAYDVVKLIGMGGMGAVYEAVRADDQYRKRVAIKIVQRGLDSELTLARFRRERQILASLEHPNIATLLDGGVTPDGRPFLVMEFVEGDPITIWCDARKSSLRDRLALFRQVCGAVQHAHKNLVVHRDLKPGNIFVTPDGTVKLLDFGIAKLLGDDASDDAMPLTRGGARPFTPEYASPEQIRGLTLTTASDVYSLGVVLFELLAGRRPHVFPSRAVMDIEQIVLSQPVPRPSMVVTDDAAVRRGERSADRLRRKLRGELDQIVLMSLRHEPERRYASVDALDNDLRRHLTGLPIAAQRDWAGYRLRKFVKRNAAAVTASLLVLVALVGGVISTSAQATVARAAQLRAERVSGFLRDLLSSVRPATGGRDVPVSEVLDGAARRISTELVGQPAVRAELEMVIGQSYQSLGRYDDAARHLNEALILRRQINGPTSPEYINAVNNVAGLLSARGELDQADTMLRSALVLKRSSSSKPDTLLALLLDNLGSVAHSKGQEVDGERLHGEALAIRRQVLGPHDDAIAFSLNNMAVARGEQNNWAAAESLHREALAIVKGNHPPPHPLVADVLNALATALDLQGKNEAAESAYVEVINMRRQLLGADHPDYAFSVFNYAMFSFDKGHYEKAMELSQQVLAQRGKSIPESHPSIAASLQTLGRCLDKLGDTTGGRRALEESLELRKKYQPPGSWLVASSEGVLGEHFTLTKDYPKAEQLLLHADEVMSKVLGRDNPRTQTNLKRMISLYDASGQQAKAVATRAKLTPPKSP